MRPDAGRGFAFFRLLWKGEAAGFMPLLNRIGDDQSDHAVGIAQTIKATIGVSQRSLAKLSLFQPGFFAIGEFQTSPAFVVEMSIDVLTDEDDASFFIAVFFLVDFGDVRRLVSRWRLDQISAL